MIELTLVTLLQTMAPRYCHYKKSGFDDTKATLLAYSEMHDQYKPSAIRQVVRDGKGFEAIAIGLVATTCPGASLQ